MFQKILFIITICLTIKFSYATTLAPTVMYIEDTTLYTVNNKFSFQIPDLAKYKIEDNVTSSQSTLSTHLVNEERQVTITISVIDITDKYRSHNAEITKKMRLFNQQQREPNLLFLRKDSQQGYSLTKSLLTTTLNGQKIEDYSLITNTHNKLLYFTITLPQNDTKNQLDYVNSIINSFKVN